MKSNLTNFQQLNFLIYILLKKVTKHVLINKNPNNHSNTNNLKSAISTYRFNISNKVALNFPVFTSFLYSGSFLRAPMKMCSLSNILRTFLIASANCTLSSSSSSSFISLLFEISPSKSLTF